MNISSVSIRNFRGIGSVPVVVEFSELNLLIGNNGTSKTAILEALNLCLSSTFAASGRLSIRDFHRGADGEIEIRVTFQEPFDVKVPDGHANQIIKCNAVLLRAKKRDKSAPGKAFNDLVVIDHTYVPTDPPSDAVWVVRRKNNTEMKIGSRQLALSYAEADLPRVFYFPRDRGKQLRKGLRTSISNVIDDLNWRFEKRHRGASELADFRAKREAFEGEIIDSTDGDTLEKTIEATNKTLAIIGIDGIDLSLVRTLTPYDSAELVRRLDTFEIPIASTGSGLEMVTALAFLVTLARISKAKIALVIDEPELHLHPELQEKLVTYLFDISSQLQVVASTHSPFVFRGSYGKAGVRMTTLSAESGCIVATDTRAAGYGLFKWSPSWGEICYFAYNLCTPEFHDELYAALQDKFAIETNKEMEDRLVSEGYAKEISWTDATGGLRGETLITYVRHRIHHPENLNRPAFTPQQLRDSTERLITLLRRPNS